MTESIKGLFTNDDAISDRHKVLNKRISSAFSGIFGSFSKGKEITTAISNPGLDALRSVSVNDIENAPLENKQPVIKIDGTKIVYSSVQEALNSFSSMTTLLLLFITMILEKEQDRIKESNTDTSVQFRLSDFQNLCGRSDKKQMRRDVEKALTHLSLISVGWRSANRDFFDKRIVIGKGIERGIVTLLLDKAFALSLVKLGYRFRFPLIAFSFNQKKNPLSLLLLIYLSQLNKMDTGENGTTGNVVSFRKLLPRVGISTDGVRAFRRIYQRLLRDLDALNDVLTYEIQDVDGNPFDPEAQLGGRISKDTFLNLKLVIHWKVDLYLDEEGNRLFSPKFIGARKG